LQVLPKLQDVLFGSEQPIATDQDFLCRSPQDLRVGYTEGPPACGLEFLLARTPRHIGCSGTVRV